jgi:hypothetical protein
VLSEPSIHPNEADFQSARMKPSRYTLTSGVGAMQRTVWAIGCAPETALMVMLKCAAGAGFDLRCPPPIARSLSAGLLAERLRQKPAQSPSCLLHASQETREGGGGNPYSGARAEAFSHGGGVLAYGQLPHIATHRLLHTKP